MPHETPEQPEISCILPTYENIALAARSLLSVLTQQNVSFEVIVTDDSRSTDVRDFVQLLSQKFPQLRYIDGPRNGRPVDNWNCGLQHARGKYCVVIHHDEFLLDALYFRRAIDALENSNAPATIGKSAVIGMRRRSKFEFTRRWLMRLGHPIWVLLAINWIGPTANVIYRREGNPAFDASYVFAVDVEFYFRLLSGQSDAIFLDGISVGSIGHHAASITSQNDVWKLYREEIVRVASDPRFKLPAPARHSLRLYSKLRYWLSRK